MAPAVDEAPRAGTGRRRTIGALLGAAFLLLAIAGPVRAHEDDATVPRLEALRVTTPVSVDGDLGEPAWREAPVGSEFVQREPEEGEPATEPTEIRVVYTEDTLYIGIMAYEKHPDALVAETMQRDGGGGGGGGRGRGGRLDSDDSVIVVLDTFHDHRNALFFETNPNGVRSDALVTDEGRDRNFAWDGVWWAAAAITPDGWSAELAIPFSTLRFDAGLETWGMNVRRRIRHANEEVYWSPIERDADIFRISRAGHLTGIRDPQTGANLRLKPFTVVSSAEDRSTAPRTVEEEADLGLDVRWGVTQGLTLDLTYNTDFAQVEVDEQRVNLTRFSLFFPEKREFFLEGAGIFEFGPGQQGGGFRPPLFKLFFSRRIGIGPGGQEVPILGGVRLTGRVGEWNLGLLDVQTEATRFPELDAAVPDTNWSVVRIKRNLGERSSVGVMATNRQSAGDDYNRTLGVDTELNPHRKLNLNGFYALSDEPGVSGDNWTAGGGAAWRGPKWQWNFDYQEIRQDFDPEMGFLLRRGIRRYAPEITWLPRPGGPFRFLRFQARSEVITDVDGTLESVDTTFNPIGFNLDTEDFVTAFYSVNFERLEAPFEIQPGIVIPPGEYTFREGGLFWRSNDSRMVSFNGFLVRGEFFNGTRTTLRPELTFRPSGHFNMEFSWDRNDVDLPQGEFVTNILRHRTNAALTPELLFNSFLQFSDANELLSWNFRFNWIYRPGADFFLVYNQTWETDGPGGMATRDRAVIAKFTYLFQF